MADHSMIVIELRATADGTANPQHADVVDCLLRAADRIEHLERQLAAARREERERCARVCDLRLTYCDQAKQRLNSYEYGAHCAVEGRKQEVAACAAAIRALPDEPTGGR